MNKRFSLQEVTKDLVAVAKGAKPAQMVIKGGKLINVNTGEIIPNVRYCHYPWKNCFGRRCFSHYWA